MSMRGSYPIECLYCNHVANSKVSDNMSLVLLRKHVKEKHPDKKVP